MFICAPAHLDELGARDGDDGPAAGALLEERPRAEVGRGEQAHGLGNSNLPTRLRGDKSGDTLSIKTELRIWSGPSKKQNQQMEAKREGLDYQNKKKTGWSVNRLWTTFAPLFIPNVTRHFLALNKSVLTYVCTVKICLLISINEGVG